MQNRRVPPFFGEPRPAYHSPPRRRMAGTAESVSTLLMTVGDPYRPDDGGEGRPDARIAALAFERFHQRRFFAAFVGARAGVRDQIEIESAAENIFAEIARGVGFFDGRVHDVQHVAIFAANVDVALMRADRAPGDDDAFDQLMRIHFHQRTVLAGAGLALIGVAENVFRLRRFLGHEAPLHARWESPRRRARADSISSLRRRPARASFPCSAVPAPCSRRAGDRLRACANSGTPNRRLMTGTSAGCRSCTEPVDRSDGLRSSARLQLLEQFVERLGVRFS